jgi:TonB family protein
VSPIVRRLALGVLLAVAVPAVTQEYTSEGAKKETAPAGQLTKAPELLRYVEAAYPPQAFAEHVQGEVILLIDIDETGAVAGVRVDTPAGHGFDEAALAAASQFEFSPAEIDGKPAPVRITYRYNFRMTEVPRPQARQVERKSEVNLEGRVLESGTRHPLPGVDVVLDDGAASTVTDANAHFEFKNLAPKQYKVVINIPGYQRFETGEQVSEGKRTETTYHVRKRSYSQYETVVRAEKERTEVAQEVMTNEEISLIPGTNGDALKVVQNLPGVARAPYGFGILLVRGGTDWDTRVYLDDTYIPLLFHFAGLTSTFNADLLENITFMPGNFNADMGRATGGLVQANIRTPATDGYHGYVDANVYHAGALLEGPIADGWSFALSGRRSYVDLVLQAALNEFFPNAGVSFTVAPVYWDYQAVVRYEKKGNPDQLTIALFGSSDASKFFFNNAALIDPEGRNDVNIGIAYNRLGVTWDHRFDSTLSDHLHLALGTTSIDNSFGPDVYLNAILYSVELRDRLTKDLAPWLTVEGGVDFLGAQYRYTASGPPVPVPNQLPNLELSQDDVYAREINYDVEPALFAQAIVRPLPGLKIVPSIRADYDSYLRDYWVDPRIAGFWNAFGSTTFKAGVGVYQEPPDWRYGATSAAFGNPDLKHESSYQYMVGVEQQITENISLDLQLYYKWLFNLVEPSTNVVVRDGQEVLERYDNGALERSYGLEVLLRHKLTHRLFGWIAYTLSRSVEHDSLSPGWYLYPLDQTHNLIAVLSYKLPYDFIVGTRVQYATGNPFTPYDGCVLDTDAQRCLPVLPTVLETRRVPAFFQWDLRVDKRFIFDNWKFTIYLDVQNVTNRQNAESVTYNWNYTQYSYLTGLPIIPSLGLKGEF